MTGVRKWHLSTEKATEARPVWQPKVARCGAMSPELLTSRELVRTPDGEFARNVCCPECLRGSGL